MNSKYIYWNYKLRHTKDWCIFLINHVKLNGPCDGSLGVWWNWSNFHLDIANKLLEKSTVTLYFRTLRSSFTFFLLPLKLALCVTFGLFLLAISPFFGLTLCLGRKKNFLCSALLNLPPGKLFYLLLKYLELHCLPWQSLAMYDYLNISKMK